MYYYIQIISSYSLQATSKVEVTYAVLYYMPVEAFSEHASLQSRGLHVVIAPSGAPRLALEF